MHSTYTYIGGWTCVGVGQKRGMWREKKKTPPFLYCLYGYINIYIYIHIYMYVRYAE